MKILHEENVREVFQSHSLRVTLTLADGTRYVTKEPVIDEIGRQTERCGDPCKNIRYGTE